MKITLFQNVSERNQMDKALTKVKDIDGKFKQSTNIMSPVLVLSYATLPDFNYIYIEELARYYFVDSITSINEGLWQINCSEDVLETYRNGILDLTAYVTRNENEYNDYIIDKYLIKTAKKLYDIITPLENESDGRNLFLNNNTFNIDVSHDGAPAELSSETNSFCYTISTSNTTGGAILFDPKTGLPTSLDYMRANIDNNQYSKYSVTQWGKQFYHDSFNKVWALNNNNLQAIGSLLKAQVADIESGRMYENLGQMINGLKVYPFSIPEYFYQCGISPDKLPQGNYADYMDNKQGYNINIQPITIGNTAIENIVTSEKNTIGQSANLYGAPQLTGWLLPHQIMSCKLATFGFDQDSLLYNNYLDYEPYTQLQLYVPFFGYITIPTNIVIGNKIYLYLSVDFITGLGTLYITVDINGEETLINTQNSKIAYDLAYGSTNINELERLTELTKSRDGNRIISNILGNTLGVLSSIPIGTINPIAGVTMGLSALANTARGSISDITTYFNDVDATATTPLNGNTVSGGGSQNGASNLISPRGIFIIRERVEQYRPATNYKHYLGRPLEVQRRLSRLHGFTKVGSVHIEGRDFAKATEQEKQIIEQTLKNGFILR